MKRRRLWKNEEYQKIQRRKIEQELKRAGKKGLGENNGGREKNQQENTRFGGLREERGGRKVGQGGSRLRRRQVSIRDGRRKRR
jgi:hypothetical protein